jgi:cytochrome c-type biogenesis protein CcmH
MRRALPWLALVVVVAGALVVGARDADGPATEAERVRAIAREVRCPTCRGLSAAESDAKAAQAIRDEVTSRVRAGESDGEIRAFLVSRYGRDILLRPEAGGVSALVWALPVAAVVCAAGGLVVAFHRWGSRTRGSPSADDRALVERALGEEAG